MASRKYKPGEYFRRSVLAKSFEHNSEQSEDKSVDISRKDLDGDEPVVDERESRSTRKNVEEDLPREKSKKSQPKTQAQAKLNLPPKYFACPPFSIIAIALGTSLCMSRGAIFCPLGESPSLHINRPLGALSKDHTVNTMPIWAKMIPYLRIENFKNHTLSHGKYQRYIAHIWKYPSPRMKALCTFRETSLRI